MKRTGKTKTPFTLVIPAFNEKEETLGKMLDDVMAQTHRPKEVVIDAAGNVAEIKKITKRHLTIPFRFSSSKPLGPAYGRNGGGALAKTGIILFLDADTRFASDLFENTVSAFVKKKLGLATVNIVPQPLPSRIKTAMLRIGFRIHNKIIRDSTSVTKIRKVRGKYQFPYISGFFMMVTKEAFEKVKGFDETAFPEDADFSRKVVASGYKYMMLQGDIAVSPRRYETLKKAYIALREIWYFTQYARKHGKYPVNRNYQFGHHYAMAVDSRPEASRDVKPDV